ncbi:hypothetical protein B0H63DRAFT_510658 [Podospora didyma]|uniref:Protein kinase domain-containing protein n=1 Tax=Podospora didyma TaxID=330526 RepID=A0AAE0NQT5_9PEZI|nr:hypothetical protein B0H63DRAFT_510658 [Podospora didyma]
MWGSESPVVSKIQCYAEILSTIASVEERLGIVKPSSDKLIVLELQRDSIKTQIEFLRRVDRCLIEQQAGLLQRLIFTLHTKLAAADAKLDVSDANDNGHPFPGDVTLGESIDDAATDQDIDDFTLGQTIDELSNDLNSWLQVFDAAWLLMLLPFKFEGAKKFSIRFSTARVLEAPQDSTSKSGIYIVETLHIPQTAGNELVRVFAQSINNLAALLHSLEPTSDAGCGLLRSHGTLSRPFYGSSSPKTIGMAFKVPGYYRLDQAVQVAKQLASAVGLFHACGITHKSVRPENVLLFPFVCASSSSSTGGVPGGSAFLVGFDQIRHNSFPNEARPVVDERWSVKLYRHPETRGDSVTAQERNIMNHDIYSLGVCLLGMGLGETLLFITRLKVQEKDRARRFLDLRPDDEFKVSDEDVALFNKAKFVKLAGRELRARAGDIYADVVLGCLTCLDDGNEVFGDEKALGEDKDGVVVGVLFVEQVMMELGKIVV